MPRTSKFIAIIVKKTNACRKIILCGIKCALCPTCNQTYLDFIPKPFPKLLYKLFHHSDSEVIYPSSYDLIHTFDCDRKKSCYRFSSFQIFIQLLFHFLLFIGCLTTFVFVAFTLKNNFLSIQLLIEFITRLAINTRDWTYTCKISTMPGTRLTPRVHFDDLGSPETSARYSGRSLAI